MTTAILIKLLATKIVANSFLGFSNNRVIIEPLLPSSSIKSSRSFCESENKATSEPEIKAEQKSRKITAINPISSSKSMVFVKLEGSGSKVYYIN